MSSFSVGGLATGLDTKSIVDQLMQIEGRTKTKMEWKQQLWTARKSAWSDLNSRLNTLQTLGNKILSPSTWVVGSGSGTGAWGATSLDPSRLSATTTGTPTAASYAVNVLQLAQGEIDLSSGTLGPATAGQRTTGAWYEGAANPIEGNENITALRTSTGATMGLNTNSVITMNYTVNGVAQSAAFKVNTLANGGQGTTMTAFTAWVASTVGGGATAQVMGAGPDAGKLRVTTGAGTALELDALSFTAVNAGGTTLAAFNASVGAATSTQTLAASDGGVASAETLTITGGAGTWNVALAAGDQKQDIVNKINATSGIGVLASLVGSNIQLRSTTTGAASGFTVSSTGTTAGLLNFAETQTAQDAQYTVNGTSYTSATNNNVTGAITDVALNFSGTTNTTLTVAQGTGTGLTPQEQWIKDTKTKIQDFVNQYNSTLDLIHQKTQGESRVTNPKNLQEYLQGPVARDYQFSQVGFDLRRLAGESVAGLPAGASMLRDVGIDIAFSIGGGAANGRLTIDDTKLENALRTAPTDVQNVLTKVGGSTGPDADDGIIRALSEQVSLLRVGGRVDTALTGASNQVRSIQDSIERASDRLDRRRVYYEKMFSSLETRVSAYQSQGAWLSGQIAGLSGGSN